MCPLVRLLDGPLGRLLERGYVMTVTVIVVTFNGCFHLGNCLAALAVQTLRADQVIVVDNSSTDGSPAYLKDRHPGVTLVALTKNVGFAGGNIAGFEAATGDYIVLLNNDTKPSPDWLERLVECADSHPEVGIVASHLTDWEGRFTDTAGDGCSVTGRGFKLREGQSTGISIESGYVFSACAGAALYKRRMLEEVGFLEPDFFMNAEDTDLAFRARLAGWRTFLCADAVVRHRVGASQVLYSDHHVFYSTRNHLWLYLRCMPLSLAAKHTPALIVQTFIYLAVATRQGRARAFVRAIVAAAAGLPRVLRQRRAIQARRRISVAELERELTPFSQFIRVKLRMAGKTQQTL
jgi:GT2 family glycosyltransferase